VRAGSPAYEQGLNAKNRIIALDGARVDSETFAALIAARRPGDTVRVSLFRNDDLRTLDIKLGGRVNAPYRIVPLPSPTDQQKRVYQSWLSGR
jgi:predicted metalloprotease with PDZ domain